MSSSLDEAKGKSRMESRKPQVIRFVESEEQDEEPAEVIQLQKREKNESQRVEELVYELIVELALVDFDQESENSSNEEDKEIKRVKQSNIMFALVILASLITATENLYIYLGTMPYRDIMFIPPTLIFRFIVFPASTYNLCKNFKVIRRLYFMLDKILMSSILIYIGVLGFILIFLPFTPSPWLYQSLIVLFPLMYLCYTGHYRVMLVYCDWERWQVLSFKATLMIGAMSYFFLGIYYLVNQLRFTRGLSPELDNTIQSLLLIFINAGFQNYLEMISKMDSTDGSADFKMDYRLQCNPEDMEVLLKGKKKSESSSSNSSSMSSMSSFNPSQISNPNSCSIRNLNFEQIEPQQACMLELRN